MAKYIHVVSSTKVPENRGSNTTPFEEFATNPNGGGFGSTERTMFLAVEEPAQPTYNSVLQSVDGTTTPDINGKNVTGEYISATDVWRFTWALADNDLATAQQQKFSDLSVAQATALDAGYAIGAFVFPYTEAFFRQLADRHYWLDIAINDGEVPADSQITFSDQSGKEVSVGLAALRNNFRQYGSDYLRIFEKEVDARDAINAAITPQAVDDITWTF